MSLNLDLTKAILSASFWLSIFLAYMFFRRRDAAGAKYISIFMVLNAQWAGGVLLGLLADSMQLKELSLAIAFVSATFSPSIILAFVLDYCNLKKWLTWRNFLIVNIFPILILIISFMPSWNHLIWEINISNLQPHTHTIGHGILFWCYLIYGYSILICSFFILFKKLNVFSTFLKSQTFFFVLSTLVAVSFNLLHAFNSSIFNHIDITPIGFAISFTVLFFGIFNFKIFELLPAAREQIFENSAYAILVLNNHFKIVSHNKAFVALFQFESEHLTGKYLDSVFPKLYSEMNISLSNKISEPVDFIVDFQTYELTFTQVTMRNNNFAGIVITLNPITELRKLEQNIQISNIHLVEQMTINEQQVEDIKVLSQKIRHNIKNPLDTILEQCKLMPTPKDVEQQFEEINHNIDIILKFTALFTTEILIEKVSILDAFDEAIKENTELIERTSATIIQFNSCPEMQGNLEWMTLALKLLLTTILKTFREKPTIEFEYKKILNKSVLFHINVLTNSAININTTELYTWFNSSLNNNLEKPDMELILVKRIIQKMNGEINAEIHPKSENGVSFFIKLPH